jgi:serine/threonine protein kinase/tetratricopeptide (TPR) repeat protein
MDVADLPQSDRAAALERTCGGDAKLRAEVEALLHANGQAGGFMKSPTNEHGDASRLSMHFEPGGASGEEAGRQIGPYKLLELIGEGGFGSVWMAEQREPVKRRVALKLIKLGMDTKQVIARFEAERQALAMMDHPNIAKVLDAGSTEAGRPYFVMEYIRGIPILEYCDRERLDTRSRLDLFTSVCHAIQHAHQKGIIHRDIKPSNVLVTLHDGVAVPKVIDFGVAKATNSELTTKTLFTEHRQMIGTPAYMSPEQAEMSGLDIDTRSDIYSLGVLLYELLTGTTPFDVYDLMSKGYEQMMRIIREEEPHKPSTRVSSLGDTSTRTALQRRVDAKTLGSLLRGDLDWIVMKCLEKDRSRRYETANGLAADIRRHLNDEPVMARAPSAGYKLRKFVKRNRAGVFAAGAIVATLLAGVIAFAWQAKVAGDERDSAVRAKASESEQRLVADAAKTEAEQQEARAKEQEAEAKKQEAEARKQEAEAKQQAAIAEAVARFQTDMLAAADPQKLLGDKVTVLQAMHAAIAELDKGSLADQPLVEAQVRNTIGMTLLGLGRYDDAETNLRKSLEIRRAVLPAGRVEISIGLNNLAMVLYAQNKLTKAEPLYREALEIMRAAFPAGHPKIAAALNNLAALLQAEKRFAEAEPLFREALAIRRAALPGGHRDIAQGLNNLAELLRVQNELGEAEPLFREALDIHRKSLSPGHPEIAICLDNLAKLLGDRDGLAEAVLLMREALEIRRAAFPAGHPDIALGLNNLAMLLWQQNKLSEAEPMLREALEIRRAAFPALHPEIAISLHRLGNLLIAQNKLSEAEPLLREALEIARGTRPAGHHDLLDPMRNLADLYAQQGETDKTIPLLREIFEAGRATLPKESPELAAELAAFSRALLDLKAWDAAEPVVRECLTIREKTQPDHWTTFNTQSMLGAVLLGQKKLAEAEPLLLAGYRGMKKREGSILQAVKVLRISEALERLVQLYEATGNATEAAAWRSKLEAARAAESKAGGSRRQVKNGPDREPSGDYPGSRRSRPTLGG